MSNAMARLWDDESGATAIEYGVMAAMIAVACIAAFIAFGGGLQTLFGSVDTKTAAALATNAL